MAGLTASREVPIPKLLRLAVGGRVSQDRQRVGQYRFDALLVFIRPIVLVVILPFHLTPRREVRLHVHGGGGLGARLALMGG